MAGFLIGEFTKGACLVIFIQWEEDDVTSLPAVTARVLPSWFGFSGSGTNRWPTARGPWRQQ